MRGEGGRKRETEGKKGERNRESQREGGTKGRRMWESKKDREKEPNALTLFLFGLWILTLVRR